MYPSLRIGIVGASGAVGTTLINVLEKRNFPLSQLSLFGSIKSIGQNKLFNKHIINIQNTTIEDLLKQDIVFFCANSSISQIFIPTLIKSGVKVIDKSSLYRMNPEVPLIIPEINAHILKPHHKLIANPNCSAIVLLMTIAPLIKLGTIKKIIVSTYQSASGGGKALMDELLTQTEQYIQKKEYEPSVAPHPYAFNLFSHNTPINEQGLNEEESKMIEESQKILDNPSLTIIPTCIRVPVLRCHTESITLEFEGLAPSPQKVREAFEEAKGIKIVDDPHTNTFPMPSLAEGQDDILVGRIRLSPHDPSCLQLLACGDQLLKGAALNAVQIAEHLISL